jgi:hypothetical protein
MFATFMIPGLVVFAAAWLAQERAAEPVVQREWVGIEISPLSVNAGSAGSGAGAAAPHRFDGGPGATIRLLRFKWTTAYVTPVMAGLFLGLGDPNTILAHVLTEAGARFSTGVGTLELGLAAGVGILAIQYDTDCDGRCNLGGAGVMISPVVRHLFWEESGSSVGFSLRAMIPLQVPEGDTFGYFSGRGMLFLGALDLALGRGQIGR